MLEEKALRESMYGGNIHQAARIWQRRPGTYARLMNFLLHFVPVSLTFLGDPSHSQASRPSESSLAGRACAERRLGPDLPRRCQASHSGDCCTAPVMSSITAVAILSALILQTKPGCRVAYLTQNHSVVSWGRLQCLTGGVWGIHHNSRFNRRS